MKRNDTLVIRNEKIVMFSFQSFSEKLVGLMARPGQTDAPKDDIPWYLRYGAQGLGIFGAFCKTLFHSSSQNNDR